MEALEVVLERLMAVQQEELELQIKDTTEDNPPPTKRAEVEAVLVQ